MILLFLFSTCFAGFYESFIGGYDLSGRYTHEYHPFLLDKTVASFLTLEERLREHFSVRGRLVIFGFQQEAMQPYIVKRTRAHLQDEVITKTEEGVTQPAKNIFGFMSGFLLKDAQWLYNRWFPGKRSPCISAGAEMPTLFEDDALLFQKHAFSKEYEPLMATRDRIEHILFKGDNKKVLQELITYWSGLYERNNTNESYEQLGTQDILFSISYAKSLVQGSTPLKTLFIGPDITFPIEVSDAQHKDATKNAQAFVSSLDDYFVAEENKKTAYIFCSFVDGVGKSTLLNNVRNYKLYGTDFSLYKRCDNSSSQRASVYPFSDKVYIVDLPAQISHFTVKPDGMVFVPLETEKGYDRKQLTAYFSAHKESCTIELERLRNRSLSTNLLDQYVSLLVLFNKHTPWIPCWYNKELFLFHEDDPSNIKVLVPLEQAHSIGLKVVDPEMMLFTNGLSLPLPYDAFISDLVDQLKKHGVEQLVLVDFMSMYPRTSRETIRINFIMQYLKKVCGIDHSFYRQSPYKHYELCDQLLYKRPVLHDMLATEAQFRHALYKVVTQGNNHGFLSGAHLEKAIRSQMVDTVPCDVIEQRLLLERSLYYERYSHDRIYESIIRFSKEPVLAFSKLVTKQEPLCKKELSRLTDKDERSFGKWIRQVRAYWYMQLTSWLTGDAYPVLPLAIDDALTAYTENLMPAEQQKVPDILKPFNLTSIFWGRREDDLFIRSFTPSTTATGIYAYGYEPAGKDDLSKVIDALRTHLIRDGYPQRGITTSELYERLPKKTASSNGKQLSQDNIRFWVRMIATLEMIAKDPQGIIMVRKGCKHDFQAALRLLERFTLPLLGVQVPENLFEDYSEVEPVIPWDQLRQD